MTNEFTAAAASRSTWLPKRRHGLCHFPLLLVWMLFKLTSNTMGFKKKWWKLLCKHGQKKARNIYTVAADTRTIDLTFLACSLRAARREESNLASSQVSSRTAALESRRFSPAFNICLEDTYYQTTLKNITGQEMIDFMEHAIVLCDIWSIFWKTLIQHNMISIDFFQYNFLNYIPKKMQPATQQLRSESQSPRQCALASFTA